jgi:hypothetical protein
MNSNSRPQYHRGNIGHLEKAEDGDVVTAEEDEKDEEELLLLLLLQAALHMPLPCCLSARGESNMKGLLGVAVLETEVLAIQRRTATERAHTSTGACETPRQRE